MQRPIRFVSRPVNPSQSCKDFAPLELVKRYTIQSDQRTAIEVHEFGTTVMRTRTIPDDLERNVDLPPTETGGGPQDDPVTLQAARNGGGVGG